MQHIYRQTHGLKRFRAGIMTWNRENEEAFPFKAKFVFRLPKHPWRGLRRLLYRYIYRRPLVLSRAETIHALTVFYAMEAKLLHVYFGNIAMRVLPLIKALPQPVVVSFHGADATVNLEHPAWRAAMQEVLQLADRVLTRSESISQHLIKLGCPPEKIRLQRTNLPIFDWPYLPRAIPADGQWRLLQSGRLVEKKGFATTLRAFATIRQAWPLARLDIIGDGPELGSLEKLAKELDVASSVKFHGFLPQMLLREELYRSHLYFHPSETGRDGNEEGVPNALLEAMATGQPVFATRHGGIPEAIRDGEEGMLVDEQDHQGLAHAALAVMANGERYTSLAEKGRAAVEGKFDRNTQLTLLENVYEELILEYQTAKE